MNVASFLSALNDIQRELPDQREERIHEQWGRDGGFARTTDEDAIWYLAHADDWPDQFIVLTGWEAWPREIESWLTSGTDDARSYPSSMWDEPMPTEDALDRLKTEWIVAKRWADGHPTPGSLRRERNLHIALEGLRARYARTGDERMGW